MLWCIVPLIAAYAAVKPAGDSWVKHVHMLPGYDCKILAEMQHAHQGVNLHRYIAVGHQQSASCVRQSTAHHLLCMVIHRFC